MVHAHKYHTSIQVCAAVFVHADSRAGLRVPSSITLPYSLETEGLTEPGACSFMSVGWLMSTRDPPVSTPILELYTYAAKVGFFFFFQGWIFM